MKPVKSFRIDQELIDKANEMGLELAPMIEAMIAKAEQSRGLTSTSVDAEFCDTHNAMKDIDK